ncbi:MAG: hypothetical protein JWQ71_325 [Pedosphaera sp.]|nr:hypothetical protein [Pedosphaera sp.]
MKSKKTGGLVLIVLAIFSLYSGYSQPLPTEPAAQASISAGAGAVPTNLSPTAAEVVRLVESGVSDEVATAYIQGSKSYYNLSADDILYLKDVGLSSPVVTAMLSHDTALRNQPGQNNYDQNSYPPTNPGATAPSIQQPPLVPEPAPAPAVEVAPPAYVSNAPAEVNYFYNDLSPYGSWVELDGVGWCWQPRTVIVNREWRPYSDGGHWVYTDAGWYWQSDYSWGWAPFHYGRWYRHERCGWVWTPDTVWAPAWVTWRISGDNCGWAPLPPRAYFDARSGYRYNGVSVGVTFDFGLHADHFTFVALRDFRERDLGHRRLPPTQVKNVYNNTTIVNNYVVNNNTIVNKGVPVERVAAVTHTEVKKVAIRDAPTGGGRNTRVAGRNEAVVYRPQLKAPAKPISMVAQKVDDRHPVVQHREVPLVKAQQKSGVTSNPFAPTATNPRNNNQTGNSNIRRPQNGQPTVAPNVPSASSPNVRQPTLPNSSGPTGVRQQAAPLTPTTPNVRQPVTPILPAAPTPPAPTPSRQEQIKQSSKPVDISKPDASVRVTAPDSSAQRKIGAPEMRGQNQNQNSRFYYPKGYNPPPATRAVPNSNPNQNQIPRPSNQDNDRDKNGRQK